MSDVTELSQDRLQILKKAEEYELLGFFDHDLENDPPTRPLRPGEVDFLGKKRSSKVSSNLANHIAKKYFDGLIKKGELMIDSVIGIENYLQIQNSGAILSCNHFHPYDNYAVYKAIEPYLGKKRLYKIIREGNFTSFPGLYGYFFRHCNTLPLASDSKVLFEMMRAVQTLLKSGNKILIYPEQGMWWNYRKPRPLKLGAFQFAARAGVPVLPIFITLQDSDKKDATGFPIQRYTLHILPPIFPDASKTVRENAKEMLLKNYAAWKEIYEKTYGIPLTYTTKGEVNPCSI